MFAAGGLKSRTTVRFYPHPKMKALAYIAWFASATALAFAQDNKKAEQSATAAVQKGHEAFLAAMRGNDAKGLVPLLAPDVIFYPPNAATVVGPEGVRTWFQSIVDAMKTTSVTVAEHRITLAGDHAIEEGNFIWKLAPVGGGAPIEDRGRFLAVWKRHTDGSMKVVRNIWNSTLPLADATASNAADPWLGTWVLNLAKTRVNPGPKPRSETRIYTSTPNGEHATYDLVEADGKRIQSSSTYNFDGKDAKLLNDPNEDTMAITRAGPRSIAAVIKKDGKVIRTATREVSTDGKTLTVQFKGTNAKGQAIVEEVWVFDRK